MEKVTTFLDKNKTWFSWGTMVTLLGAAVWLIQSMNGITNTLNVMNVNLDNLNEKTSDRAIYVDDRLNDFEVRLRELERINHNYDK